jgi:hypothetical protein
MYTLPATNYKGGKTITPYQNQSSGGFYWQKGQYKIRGVDSISNLLHK